VDEKDPVSLNLILTSAPTSFGDYPSTTAELIVGLIRGDRPQDILKTMENAAYDYRGHNLQEGVRNAPDLFIEDGFVEKFVPAPGWPKLQ
jgi:hypothetical protein